MLAFIRGREIHARLYTLKIHNIIFELRTLTANKRGKYVIRKMPTLHQGSDKMDGDVDEEATKLMD